MEEVWDGWHEARSFWGWEGRAGRLRDTHDTQALDRKQQPLPTWVRVETFPTWGSNPVLHTRGTEEDYCQSVDFLPPTPTLHP